MEWLLGQILLLALARKERQAALAVDGMRAWYMHMVHFSGCFSSVDHVCGVARSVKKAITWRSSHCLFNSEA
jgi:hypothetical protein